VADIAGIWTLQLLCLRRGDEAESVTTDVNIGNRLLDLRHVAGGTFISAARDLVMSVLFDGSGVKTIRRTRTVAFQADYIRWPYGVGAVPRSVKIMATETPDTVCVHRAGYEIIWAWLLWNDGQPSLESVTCESGRDSGAEQKPGISKYPVSKCDAQAWMRQRFHAPIAKALRRRGSELSPDFSTRRRKVATPKSFGCGYFRTTAKYTENQRVSII